MRARFLWWHPSVRAACRPGLAGYQASALLAMLFVLRTLLLVVAFLLLIRILPLLLLAILVRLARGLVLAVLIVLVLLVAHDRHLRWSGRVTARTG